MASRKLTDEQVREIRCYEKARAHYQGLAKLYKRENVAAKYGVSYSVITAIIEGHAYKNVQEVDCAEQEPPM